MGEKEGLDLVARGKNPLKREGLEGQRKEGEMLNYQGRGLLRSPWRKGRGRFKVLRRIGKREARRDMAPALLRNFCEGKILGEGEDDGNRGKGGKGNSKKELSNEKGDFVPHGANIRLSKSSCANRKPIMPSPLKKGRRREKEGGRRGKRRVRTGGNGIFLDGNAALRFRPVPDWQKLCLYTTIYGGKLRQKGRRSERKGIHGGKKSSGSTGTPPERSEKERSLSSRGGELTCRKK